MKGFPSPPTSSFIVIFFISLAALVLIPGEREVKTNPEEVKNEVIQEDDDTIKQLKSALSEAEKILPQNENEYIDYETFQRYAKKNQKLIEKLNEKLMKKMNKKEYKNKIGGDFKERIKRRGYKNKKDIEDILDRFERNL
jgi:Asp-tRNA(Asn)/Glu-tRNA(Gln) amidotransferase A subunit family amidase